MTHDFFHHLRAIDQCVDALRATVAAAHDAGHLSVSERRYVIVSQRPDRKTYILQVSIDEEARP